MVTQQTSPDTRTAQCTDDQIGQAAKAAQDKIAEVVREEEISKVNPKVIEELARQKLEGVCEVNAEADLSKLTLPTKDTELVADAMIQNYVASGDSEKMANGAAALRAAVQKIEGQNFEDVPEGKMELKVRPAVGEDKKLVITERRKLDAELKESGAENEGEFYKEKLVAAAGELAQKFAEAGHSMVPNSPEANYLAGRMDQMMDQVNAANPGKEARVLTLAEEVKGSEGQSTEEVVETLKSFSASVGPNASNEDYARTLAAVKAHTEASKKYADPETGVGVAIKHDAVKENSAAVEAGKNAFGSEMTEAELAKRAVEAIHEFKEVRGIENPEELAKELKDISNNSAHIVGEKGFDSAPKQPY